MFRPLSSVCLLAAVFLLPGCSEEAPIVTYQIPTTVPSAFAAEDTRMVAAILPQENQAWFFKLMGRESAVNRVADQFRKFVEEIEFENGVPVIDELPEKWNRGGNRPMRFASIDIDTPEQQLDLSISQLGRMDDWDALVTSNVIRWREQVGLQATEEKWSGGEEMSWTGAADAAEGSQPDAAVWIDVVGRPPAAGSPGMGTPPFAQMAAGANAEADPHAALPQETRDKIAANMQTGGEQAPATPAAADQPSQSQNKLKYDRPEGWRDGRTSMMRLAAFDVGPEDQPAEVTIISAGGELLANVGIWMGQIGESEEAAEAALAAAEELEVSGRPAQRLVLLPEDPDADDAEAIDGTIVPLQEGFSMFVKMKGPVATVREQSEQMTAFLKSLEF